MDRRRVLLVVAVLVAAAGSAMVFLYTKGADTRAEERFQTVEVLEATAIINAGERTEDAQAAGKLALAPVPRDALLDGYQTTTEGLTGTVSLSTIYPGEQIIAAKWGASAVTPTTLQIPDGMMAKSINLTDPGRVAGFVNPGSTVAVFYTGTNPATGAPFTRLLLDKVTVIGVGSTTVVSTTTTDPNGASTTEQLPRTLITLALSQEQVEQTTWAVANGELSFALLTENSAVNPDSPGVNAANLFR